MIGSIKKGILFILFLYIAFFQSAFCKEIKFIHITDTNLNYNNAPKLLSTIKEINSYNDIDFVLFGGNNLAKANLENMDVFAYLLRRLDKKTIVLMGASDVLHSNGLDKEKYLKTVANNRLLKFERHSRKPNYVFKKNGYVFVVMDGSKQYFQSTNGYYSKKEIMWLDKTLTKYKNDNVIILQHFPILEAKSSWLQTVKVEDYWRVLQKHNNVKIIISGHYGYNLEKKIGNTTHIITESYSKNHAYKIIHIDLDDNFIGTYIVK